MADYNQGRRHGNGSGQAGAFGSTNFGGFGQNTGAGFGQQSNTSGGGLFGSGNTSTPFGATQNSGFGTSNTGGGIFGQKPGALFSATSSAGSSGGLFGTTNNSTGFGSQNAAGGFGSGGGGGAFGQNSNQQQSKPFSFGSSGTAGGSGFGASGSGLTNTNTNNPSTGGGLFSNNPSNTNPFGQQNTSQGSNPFGGFGQQPQNQTQSNSSNPFGGFGQQNQEQKPGGLFGNTSTNTNAGSGLFGNQNNNQSSGGLFGQTNTNQASGSSLFGQKPASAGGLFGQSTSNSTNTGGGLFGSGAQNQNQNQSNQGGGLFGNSQSKPGGLFANTSSNSGGLFGTSNANANQQSGGSLFNLGGSNQQQQQPQQQQQQPAGSSLFGSAMNNNSGSSLFGTSQQAPQANQFQPAQTLQTSIMDPNAFGSPSIFSGLPPPPQVSGPIATPISHKSKPTKSAVLPYYKITPQTPTRRGYGFSYSNYGSPNSVSSIGSTSGGLGSSFLFNSAGRNLAKSLSTSNLRGSYGSAESVLSPGAFTTGSTRYGGASSMKKLTIDRSLRTDLFGHQSTPAALPSPEKERQPSILKKKVSFDASTVGGSSGAANDRQMNGTTEDGSATPSAQEQGLLRSPQSQPHSQSNGVPTRAESEPVRGNELAIVPEDGSLEVSDPHSTQSTNLRSKDDAKPGAYWMKPSREHIQKLSKENRQHLNGFSVGRYGCGKVEFNQPVDTSNINLNDIYETIVQIGVRSLTVYPDGARKPPRGKGLNVPSTISLENSWPRQRDHRTPLDERNGIRVNKHIDRLRKVTNTEFVDYERDTGTWIFKVAHFTTYGFDYEEEASEAESLHFKDSLSTEVPETPTPISRQGRAKSKSRVLEDVQLVSHLLDQQDRHSEPTNDRRMVPSTKVVPGSFDGMVLVDDGSDLEKTDDNKVDDDLHSEEGHLSSSTSVSGMEEPSDLEDIDTNAEKGTLVISDDYANLETQLEMVGAYPDPVEKQDEDAAPAAMPHVSGDWSLDLVYTLGAIRRDRQQLRTEARQLEHDGANNHMEDASHAEPQKPIFATSIDLMNSLFGMSPPRVGLGQGRQLAQLNAKGKNVSRGAGVAKV